MNVSLLVQTVRKNILFIPGDKMARIVEISMKIRDQGSGCLKIDGKKIWESDDYMPHINDCMGSYIDMHIDIDTGQILNWKKPEEKDIQEYIGEYKGTIKEQKREKLEEARKQKAEEENKLYLDKQAREEARAYKKYEKELFKTRGIKMTGGKINESIF